MNHLIENLNHPDKNIRLESLKSIAEKIKSGKIPKPKRGEEVNNHIHTIYSFSPYSPSKAVWLSYNAGLSTSGIMDHDSISGAEEFIEAGKIIGLATTIGLECRCDFSRTVLEGRRINNPDQKSVAYIALHGIPHNQIKSVKDYFLPYLKQRNKRNRRMVDKLNDLFFFRAIRIDFEHDVLPLSKYEEQGSITERHILFALGKKLIDKFGRGKRLISFLENDLKLNLNLIVKENLKNSGNDYYEYDLLGVLKSYLVESFYINAEAECPDIHEFTDFARQIGGITAYAYLGDIEESVTGDKKPQKFEDAFLELLFATLKDLGFQAVTYMPTRNRPAQLRRIKAFCERYGLFQISGIDINSPRQSFNCALLRKKEFRHLIDSTWALIGHEIRATENQNMGMFSRDTISRYPDLNTRIAVFKKYALEKQIFS